MYFGECNVICTIDERKKVIVNSEAWNIQGIDNKQERVDGILAKKKKESITVSQLSYSMRFTRKKINTIVYFLLTGKTEVLVTTFPI